MRVSESSHSTSVAFSVYDGDALLSTETLSQEIIKIGRLQTSDIRLDDDKVSRMHAVIEVTAPGEVFIIDLGSASGTLVNGEKINKRKLQTGDQIQVGGCRFETADRHGCWYRSRGVRGGRECDERDAR